MWDVRDVSRGYQRALLRVLRRRAPGAAFGFGADFAIPAAFVVFFEYDERGLRGEVEVMFRELVRPRAPSFGGEAGRVRCLRK